MSRQKSGNALRTSQEMMDLDQLSDDSSGKEDDSDNDFLYESNSDADSSIILLLKTI